MRFKNINSKNKNEVTQELQRLYEVEIYTGNPDAKKPKTRKETVIAWNPVDAVRQCGTKKVAKPPKFLHYVTSAEKEGGPRYKITSTAGPEDSEVSPTIKKDG